MPPSSLICLGLSGWKKRQSECLHIQEISFKYLCGENFWGIQRRFCEFIMEFHILWKYLDTKVKYFLTDSTSTLINWMGGVFVKRADFFP